MGFLDSIRGQFKPGPENVHGISLTQVPPAEHASNDMEKQEHIVAADAGEPPLKPDNTVEAGAIGAAKAEAVQSVWGKKGRYLIIAGSVLLITCLYTVSNIK
jgi:hypothetical protein